MSNVLLLVPPSVQSSGAARKAIELAKSRASKLFVTIALDPEEGRRLSERFAEIGFMGEKIGDQVSQAIREEYSLRGSHLLEEVAQLAAKDGVECETAVELGDPAEIARRAAEKKQVDAVFVVSEKRSWLSRFIKGAQPFRLPYLEGCEVTILEGD